MSQTPEREQGRILIADDEEALRRVFGRILRRDGHEVLEAATGAEAVALIERETIDVVVSDIRMPDMDGMELLRIVRERQPDVPVLLVTGAPELASAMKAVEFGAFEYVTKPIDLDKLQTSVQRALKQHREATERRRLADSAGRRAPESVRAAGQVQPGMVLAEKYRLVRLIGSGGMGTVYEAVREDLADMRVAVKILHARLADRADLVARFRREAEIVASINHPNIVKIVDFGSDPDFIVMELLRGSSLATSIEQDPPFSPERIAFIAVQMLTALGATHAVKVIHRDLKPDNVFLTTISGMDDVVKLLDFGVAKLLGQADQKLTETGIVVGTPGYMAPEYARGEKADVRGDIYAVGCVMYEALAKREPFLAANYNALMHAIQNKEPEPIEALRPEVPAGLASVIRRAMSKDPGARFQSAREMEDALAPWVIRQSGTRRASSPTLESAPTVLAARYLKS